MPAILAVYSTDSFDMCEPCRPVAVREIDARDVHTRQHHGSENALGRTRGAKCADDLRAGHIPCSSGDSSVHSDSVLNWRDLVIV